MRSVLVQRLQVFLERFVVPATGDEDGRQGSQTQDGRDEHEDEEARSSRGEGAHRWESGSRGDEAMGWFCVSSPLVSQRCLPHVWTSVLAYASARSRFSTVFHSNRLWKS